MGQTIFLASVSRILLVKKKQKAKKGGKVHIHYYTNGKGLPAALITNSETLLFSSTGNIASYEVELVDGETICTTGYMRNRYEIERWRPSTRAAFEHVEAGFVRLYPELAEGFLTTFLDQMEREIRERLRLQEEWITKQREKREKMKMETQAFSQEIDHLPGEGTA